MISMLPLGSQESYTSLEFFAGVGLARAGLQSAGIYTVWANDYDPSKQMMYTQHWGGEHLQAGDIFEVCAEEVPSADLAWSSSPCTDLSLAGKRNGIRGRESSAFFGFIDVLRGLGDRRPGTVVLENVLGLASSHGGDDLRAAIRSFNELGYVMDVLVLDARRFLPQSRPRLFMVGTTCPPADGELDTALRPDSVAWIHSDPELKTFVSSVSEPPELKNSGFSSLVENMDSEDPRWWDGERQDRFLASMSDVQKSRLERLRQSKSVSYRTAYRRTRGGKPVWEMRAEDISGCLRTARGGSSKQAVVRMGRGNFQVRWMTGLEYARLMGAGWYDLRGFRESQIQYGFGDAVAVPAVAWLGREVLIPLIRNERNARKVA